MAITPDTKDWTWVLQQTCPECGFDASALAAADVAGFARTTVADWTAILDRPDVRLRPSPEVWSPLEYACHVRDVFRVIDGRVQRMLTEDNPTLPNWDQDATAVDDRYEEQDPAVVAGELRAAATTLADRFDSVSGGQWQRPGLRSDGAPFTVESLARYCVHDIRHHIWDLTGRSAG